MCINQLDCVCVAACGGEESEESQFCIGSVGKTETESTAGNRSVNSSCRVTHKVLLFSDACLCPVRDRGGGALAFSTVVFCCYHQCTAITSWLSLFLLVQLYYIPQIPMA